MIRDLLRTSLALLFLSVVLAGCDAGCDRAKESWLIAVEAKDHSAVRPVPRRSDYPKYDWPARHQAVLDRVKKGGVDLIFIGDSITHLWEGPGKKVWERYYGGRKAVNMGFAGDRTQHALWRLDHGEIEGISPKVAVVLIGTNNTDDPTAERMADGIIAVCGRLRRKLPETKILLLAIFPRWEKPGPARARNTRASAIASRIADGKTIHHLDIGSEFLEPDGTLPKEIMPDFIHPSAEGYRLWAEAMEPKLAELLGLQVVD